MTAEFLALAALSRLLPSGGLQGWVGIHLALAGAATVAIGTNAVGFVSLPSPAR